MAARVTTAVTIVMVTRKLDAVPAFQPFHEVEEPREAPALDGVGEHTLWHVLARVLFSHVTPSKCQRRWVSEQLLAHV